MTRSLVAKTAVQAIIEDIMDRKGLKHEWRHIDKDIREEIQDVWEEIVDHAIEAHQP